MAGLVISEAAVCGQQPSAPFAWGVLLRTPAFRHCPRHCYTHPSRPAQRQHSQLRTVCMLHRYVHPEGLGGFSSPQVGQAFREAAYKAAGVKLPGVWALGGAPRTITLLSAVGAEPVSNQDALLGTLRALGTSLGFQVRPYSASTSTPPGCC